MYMIYIHVSVTIQTYHGPSIVYMWMDDHTYDCKTNVMCYNQKNYNVILM